MPPTQPAVHFGYYHHNMLGSETKNVIGLNCIIQFHTLGLFDISNSYI